MQCKMSACSSNSSSSSNSSVYVRYFWVAVANSCLMIPHCTVNSTLEWIQPPWTNWPWESLFKELSLILVHITIDMSDNITTVPSDPLWLWFFQYWSVKTERQRAVCWASHPLAFFSSYEGMWFADLCLDLRYVLWLNLIPSPLLHTAVDSAPWSTPTTFLLKEKKW